MRHSSSMIIGLALAAMLPFAASADTTELAPGTLVKVPSSSSVYYIDQDLTRYVFPNVHVFKSWYADFDGVVSVSDDVISQYPLKGHVPYKPAVRLVKIKTDPRVYAVDDGGVLRWVRTEAVARALYGEQWNQMVDDLSDAFFANYSLGADISGVEQFNKEQKRLIKAVFQTLRSERFKKLSLKGSDDDDLAHKGYGKNKVAVCHNFGKDDPHTIYIAKPALAAHLRHGDTEGTCASEEETDDETLPVISGAAVSGITSSGAVVTFTTDEDAAASVYYSTAAPVDKSTADVVASAAQEKTHEIALTGLAAGTEYHFLIQAVDAAGNVAISTEQSFTTLAADTTAPVISALTVDTVTGTSAKAHLTTDENATVQVYYSTATPVDTATAEHADATESGTSHDVDLTGLTPGTTYYAVAMATDASGNSAASLEESFTTTPAPDTTAPVISALTVDTITDASAAVHVAVDEEATIVVHYGTASPLDLEVAAHLDSESGVTSYDAALAELAAETTYYVVVTATDAAGNVTTSTEQSFTTLAAAAE